MKNLATTYFQEDDMSVKELIGFSSFIYHMHDN
jgi:hypothetical protein